MINRYEKFNKNFNNIILLVICILINAKIWSPLGSSDGVVWLSIITTILSFVFIKSFSKDEEKNHNDKSHSYNNVARNTNSSASINTINNPVATKIPEIRDIINHSTDPGNSCIVTYNKAFSEGSVIQPDEKIHIEDQEVLKCFDELCGICDTVLGVEKIDKVTFERIKHVTVKMKYRNGAIIFTPIFIVFYVADDKPLEVFTYKNLSITKTCFKVTRLGICEEYEFNDALIDAEADDFYERLKSYYDILKIKGYLDAIDTAIYGLSKPHVPKKRALPKTLDTWCKEEKEINKAYKESITARNKHDEAKTLHSYYLKQNAASILLGYNLDEKIKEEFEKASNNLVLKDSNVVYNSDFLSLLENYVLKAYKGKTIVDSITGDINRKDYSDDVNRFLKKYSSQMFEYEDLRVCFLNSVVLLFDKSNKNFHLIPYSKTSYSKDSFLGQVRVSLNVMERETSLLFEKGKEKMFLKSLDNIIEFEQEYEPLILEILNRDNKYTDVSSIETAINDFIKERDRLEEEKYDKELARKKKEKAKENKGLTEYEIRRKEQLEIMRRAEAIEKASSKK